MNPVVLSKIFIYASILLIGFIGKKLNIFKREHTKFLNNIICYITLPSAIINGFQGVELSLVLFSGLLVGLITNVLLMILGQFISKNKSNNERAIFIFSSSCFNIGNFAIPFLSGLVSADGFAAICIFDISVALMCFGVNPAIGNSIMGSNKIKVKDVVKKICTSPVFITYVVLILLSLLNIKLPQLVLDLTTTMGNANAFLAMLCIGILFQFKLKKEDWKIVIKVLSLRVIVCSLISMFIYFVIPLPSDIKIALCVLLMAPCAGAAPALTESSGADGSIAAVINSISIPLSMGLMTLLLTIL